MLSSILRPQYARSSAFETVTNDNNANEMRLPSNVTPPALVNNPFLPLFGQQTQVQNNMFAQTMLAHMLSNQAQHASAPGMNRIPSQLPSMLKGDMAEQKPSIRPFKAYNPTDPLSALQLSAYFLNSNNANNAQNDAFKNMLSHANKRATATANSMPNVAQALSSCNTQSPPQV
jgi:hypothetical protein